MCFDGCVNGSVFFLLLNFSVVIIFHDFSSVSTCGRSQFYPKWKFWWQQIMITVRNIWTSCTLVMLFVQCANRRICSDRSWHVLCVFCVVCVLCWVCVFGCYTRCPMHFMTSHASSAIHLSNILSGETFVSSRGRSYGLRATRTKRMSEVLLSHHTNESSSDVLS